MDKLLACTTKFIKLLPVQYNIKIGRKGKIIDLSIQFEKSEFHHLLGLHKLKDIAFLRSTGREKIFDSILQGNLTYEQIEKSVFFEEMASRLEPLCSLEEILDSNTLFFKYTSKLNTYSVIQAKFLLETMQRKKNIYLFIDQKNNTDLYFLKTLFPKNNLDYTKGQASYTLLYKEKINLVDGTVCVQYDRLSPKSKDTKNEEAL